MSLLDSLIEIYDNAVKHISADADYPDTPPQEWQDAFVELCGLVRDRSLPPSRMWVNQPSTLQPLHHLNGTNVLAVHEHGDTWRIYFLSGDVSSQQAPRAALSRGWTTKKGEV